MSKQPITLITWLLLMLPVVYLALFFFYPLASIFQISLFPKGTLTLEGFRTLALDPYYRRVLGFTAGQAGLSTLLTLAVGLPAAYALARYRLPGKTLLRAALTVPFVLPTVVVASAFLALLGPRGMVNSALTAQGLPPLQLQNSLTLILLAHVFYNLSVVVRIVGSFWARLDPTLAEAAAMLGANRWRTFREVTLPLLMPTIGAAALLVYLFSFGSFGVILLLGGPRYSTLETEIYYQTISLFNLPLAAALSLVQMVSTLAMTALYSRLQARATVPLTQRPDNAMTIVPRRLGQWLFLAIALGLPLLLVVAPLLALVVRSLLVAGHFSFDHYRTLDEARRGSLFTIDAGQAIRNSLLFASGTVLLSVPLGLLSAYLLARPTRGQWWRAALDPLMLLPLGTSAVTLGFGYLVALDEPPLNLRASLWLIPLAHSLVAFPFVVRALLPTLRSLPPALREAAAMLGASPWQTLRAVELPLLRPALLVGATFAFAVSMGEFGATALIARPEWPTIPVLIFRLLGQPGATMYGKALAASVILMVTSGLGFVIVERLRPSGDGEF